MQLDTIPPEQPLIFMKIANYYEALDLHRKEKILYAKFLKPHRVLSTCRLNGGLREDLDYLYNHQSCEPRNHTGIDLCTIAVQQPDKYQERIASKANIPAEKSASLGTAANMNNSAISTESYEGLEVIAVTTAGVGSNGGRAGDPASYYQTETGAQMIGKPMPKAGTINTLLFINQEVTAGAMVVAATMITEAKASVLQDLAAPSRYSDGIATGTGTDQIGIASLIGTDIVHTDANKHSKLGELIGKTVRKSLYEALNLQSGLTPDSRRSSFAQLLRFGETETSFRDGIKSQLEEEQQKLFENNFLAVNHDPVTVATVQACVHLRDQIAIGVLPESCIHETLLPQATLIAKAVSGKNLEPQLLQDQLSDSILTIDNTHFLSLIQTAFAVGFSKKWEGRFE